jgi:Kef-type K+ transport system membrane component KefB/mannitol/fructose-specific phosphotransferase system IIA component
VPTEITPSPLLVLAVVVVAGVLVGGLARRVRLPSVTGQILVGVLIGPSVLGLFDRHTVHELAPVTNFALAIIAVAVGSHLHLPRLHNARRRLFALLVAEAVITPAAVFFAVILLPDVRWHLGVLLAALAISTAPATVLAIVKEERAQGVFVKTLVAAVALNNLACISAFELAHLAVAADLAPTNGHDLTDILIAPIQQLALAIVLGGGAAFILSLLTRSVVRTDLLTTYSFAAILLVSGVADLFGISSLLSCLVLGVALANIAPEKEDIGHAVFDNFEVAIYAAFFTLAGMELDLGVAAQGGLLAFTVFVARIAGKWGAATVAMRFARAPAEVRRYLGFALVPQAGVAVGLVLVAQEDPALEPVRDLLLAVGLTVVTLNEIVGPVLARWALERSGDAGRDRRRLIDFVHEEHVTTKLQGGSKEDAITQLTDLLVRTHNVHVDRETLLRSILDRENQISTCVGEGLAIPHGELPEGDAIAGVIGISHEGLHFDTPDGRPVHCMVLLATPPSMRDRHLEVLATLARTIGFDHNLQNQLFNARTPAHVCQVLRHDTFEDLNVTIDDD